VVGFEVGFEDKVGFEVEVGFEVGLAGKRWREVMSAWDIL
jgi:hypothetical protein